MVKSKCENLPPRKSTKMCENANETNRLDRTPKHVRGDIWLLDQGLDGEVRDVETKILLQKNFH